MWGSRKQDSHRSSLFDKEVLTVIFELQEVREDEVNYVLRIFLTLLRDKVLGCQTKEERHKGRVACMGDVRAEF
jgi:hypothetical protein